MYFKKFNQYMLTYVIIYDLVVLFDIPVTLLFFFVQKNPKRKHWEQMFTYDQTQKIDTIVKFLHLHCNLFGRNSKFYYLFLIFA